MVSKKGTIARQAYQGATLGLGDELYDRAGAVYAALLGAGNYNDLLKEARSMTQDELSGDWKENPAISLGSNIVGGIPLGLTSGARSLAARAASGSRAARAAKSFGLGAGYGGIAGFGSENPEQDKELLNSVMDRISGAGIGAAIGGIIGSAGGAILPSSKSSPSGPNLQKIAKSIGKQQPSKAERYYAEILSARPDLADQLQRAKSMANASQNTGITLTIPEMIAQSGSEPLLAQQKILGTNPQTAGRMEALYASRSGDLNNEGQIVNRLRMMADELSGGQSSYDQEASKIINQASGIKRGLQDRLNSIARPLYDKSFEVGPVTNEHIDRLLENPNLKKGVARGIEIIKNEADASNQPFKLSDYAIKDFNEAGDPVFSEVPNMRLLDAAKKGLDAQIADETQPFGIVTERGRSLTLLKNALLNNVDEINPYYAEARNSYLKNPDILNSREAIGNISQIDPNNSKSVLSNLFSGTQKNASDKASALSLPSAGNLGPNSPKGAAAMKIYDALDTVRGDPTSLANRISPDARTADMLRFYVGGNQLDETLNVINQAKIGDRFRYGSPTQPLQQAEQSMTKGSSMAGDAINTAVDVKTGGISGAIRGIAKMIGKQSDNDPQFYEDLYQIFTTPRGLELMEQISKGQNQEIARHLETTGGREMVKAIIGVPRSNALNANPVANSLISGVNAPGYQNSQNTKPMNELPQGFVIQNTNKLPDGFVILQ